MVSVDAVVRSYTDDRAVLGASVVILLDGDVYYAGGFGTASVEDPDREVTPQTLYGYGSICKTICATLILRLVEKGLLNLDEPVVSYLPSLEFSNSEYGRMIALRHL